MKGYGTRLRPLTLSVPKPLIQFCNRPIIEYQIRALAAVGVRVIILAVAYKPDIMKEVARKLAKKYNIIIEFSLEITPMLTGGALKLAEGIVNNDLDDEEDKELAFVFNSDIIAEYPLKELFFAHKSNKGDITIVTTKVKEPQNFGVIITDQDTNLVKHFIEKPKDFLSNQIYAGICIIDRKILSRIDKKPVSLEREIYPVLAEEKKMYAYSLNGYWADIGKPRDFLTGTKIYLESYRQKIENAGGNKLNFPTTNSHYKIIGNVCIDPSVSIAEDCTIGPNVTIGKNCKIAKATRLINCSIMPECTIEQGVRIEDSIIGWNSHIHEWCRIDGLSVIGQDVKVEPEVYLKGVLILPHKTVSESIHTSGTVLM